MKIVLYEPQIPQNCGNIVRTCAVTGFELILVGKLGFSLSDRWLKRAGLDYWEGVKVVERASLEEVIEESQGSIYFLSSKARKLYTEVDYSCSDYLVFGSETSGLPLEAHQKWGEKFLTIPMVAGRRCLNLATSVGIVGFEAWRQQGFAASSICSTPQ